MINSLNRITQQIVSKNERLARIFNSLIEDLNGLYEQQKEGNYRRDNIIETAKERITQKVSNNNGQINLYPSNKEGRCQKICVCLAFNKWDSKSETKPGFKKAAKWLIPYWLRCKDINKGTIIFTTAWDETAFKRSYQNEFDSHTSNKDKTVVIVLLSGQSISLQYLR